MKRTPFGTYIAFSAIAATGWAMTATDARSAVIFTETADKTSYNSGWSSGSSQPENFSWLTTTNVTSPGFAGHFLGDSTNVAGGSGGDINTGGRSWGMFGHRGGVDGYGQSDAYGFLKDGSGTDAPLGVGQTLSLDLAVNFRSGYRGVAMRNEDGDELFTFNIGDDGYNVLNATTGNGSLESGYSNNTVFRIAMNQTSAGGGTWEISRSGGVSDYDTGTYSGLVSNFKLYVGQTEGGGENDFMVNNISVIPEPGSAALLLARGILVVFRRRR